MKQILVIGGIAALVLLLAKKAKADPASPDYAFNPQNWKTLPGYVAAQKGGVML